MDAGDDPHLRTEAQRPTARPLRYGRWALQAHRLQPAQHRGLFLVQPFWTKQQISQSITHARSSLSNSWKSSKK